MSIFCTGAIGSSAIAETIILQNRTSQPCTISTTQLSATPLNNLNTPIDIQSQGDHLTIFFTDLSKQLDVASIDSSSFGNVLRILDLNEGIGAFNPAVCNEANAPLANQTVS